MEVMCCSHGQPLKLTLSAQDSRRLFSHDATRKCTPLGEVRVLSERYIAFLSQGWGIHPLLHTEG